MTNSDKRPPQQSQSLPTLVTTVALLDRFKQGDDEAMNQLLERSLPPLRRWARGRLPGWARQLADTQDMVQNAVVRALPHLKSFEARNPGALQAYLRQAIVNHIRDEIRRVKARPTPTELDEQLPDNRQSPLEQAIGHEGFERYEAALQRLPQTDREAIIARLELQQSYEEVAIALGKPSAAAARMAVARAVKRLTLEMSEKH